MPKTLGIIGSGHVGSGVAGLAVAAGLDVVVSNSRGPETLGTLVTELGERARAGITAEAATADVVVLATPLVAGLALPPHLLTGKVVVDAMNYVPSRDGHLVELDSDALTSSELLQRHLAGSHVVKALNSISSLHLPVLARPAGSPERSALPVTGDDPAAKRVAGDLLDALGYDSVDVGGLAESWRFGPNTPLYALVYTGLELPADLPVEEMMNWFVASPGAPVPAAQVRQFADHAVRAPAGVTFV